MFASGLENVIAAQDCMNSLALDPIQHVSAYNALISLLMTDWYRLDVNIESLLPLRQLVR